MIATLDRAKLTVEQQSELVKASIYKAFDLDLWTEAQRNDAQYYVSQYEHNGGRLHPTEEYAAFLLCREHWRKLKKEGLELPTKAKWASTYAMQGMTVFNLTKGSSYELSWLGDDELAFTCQAWEGGRECSHIKYAMDFLGKADEHGDAVVKAPIEVVEPTQTDLELLPGIYATKGQAEALENMLDFAYGQKGLAYSLTGCAGSGKSLLVQAFAQRLPAGTKIIFTAPTNKAVRVLNEMVAQWGIGVEAITCAKLLGLKPRIDTETGQQVFEPDFDEEPCAQEYDLIVVDESSMVGTDLYDHIMREVNLCTRVLFIGDPYQAPPVGEAISRVFAEVLDVSTLTEAKRYGSAIGAIATDIRLSLQRRGEPLIESNYSEDKSTGVWSMPRSRWNDSLIKAFKSDSYKRNPNSARALAWTNKQVAKINAMVRDEIQGKDAPRFVVGERLIAKDPFYMDDIHGNEVKVLSVADECEVISVRQGHQGGYKVWAVTIQILQDDHQPVTVPVLHEDDEALRTSQLKEYSENRDWKKFWGLKGRFADLRYAYAITIHQSQGSTFDNVWVDVPNLAGNSTRNMVQFPGSNKKRVVYERWQLLYVGVTRAASRLFVPE
jgi:exodeoxyribonuclease-5